MKNKGFPFRLAPYFVAQYACNAIYQVNISNYLRGEGLADAPIGYLLTLIPVAGMLGQLIFGYIGDRARTKRRVLIALCFSSAASVALMGFAPSLLLLGAALCLYALFQMSCEPLMNTIALETLDSAGQSFGPIRSIGTLSFALLSPVIGMLIDNQYARMIYLLAGALALAAAAGFALPKVEGHARRSARRVPLRRLLEHKPLLILIGFSACLMVSISVFNTFFPIHFTSEAVGGTSAMLGWAFFISSAAELPFLLLSDRLFKRAGASTILAVAAALTAVRLVLLFLLKNPYAVLATQVLHGFGYVAITFSMAKYINLVVPMELKASGQMLFSMAALTLTRSLGSLVGGVLVNLVSLNTVFAVAATFAAASLAAFLIILSRVPDLRGAGRGAA